MANPKKEDEALRWSAEQSAAARKQGWDLYEVYDPLPAAFQTGGKAVRSNKIVWHLMRDDTSNIFLTDQAAREFVKKAGEKDPKSLAAYAVRLVFQSKSGVSL